MNFSQIWDAGFKSVMIYIGVVFFWLCFVEHVFPDRNMSVLTMNFTGLVLACAFFLWSRKQCLIEKAAAEKEIALLMTEVE